MNTVPGLPTETDAFAVISLFCDAYDALEHAATKIGSPALVVEQDGFRPVTLDDLGALAVLVDGVNEQVEQSRTTLTSMWDQFRLLCGVLAAQQKAGA
ncbi:MAG: hypothetical protein ABSB24_02780 [Gaiellaceae bacterium]|jgi:hypothetical protein